MKIPVCELSEWLAELKPYQRNSLVALVDEYGAEEAAKRWLSASGSVNTVKFGGADDSSDPFFQRFKDEFGRFICGDEKYAKLRGQLAGEGPVTRAMFISIISAALGATLGYAATLLAPVVTILLHLVGTVGVHAWCAEHSQAE